MKKIWFSKAYSKFYHHFEYRLKQRYGLEIDKLEYMLLCKSYDFILLGKKESGHRLIVLNFKGVDIKVIKQKEEEGFMLITTYK